MKRNNKAKLLMVLMFLQAILGWSKEQWAVVLGQIDFNHSGDINTSILLNRNGGNIPDTTLGLFDTARRLVPMALKGLLQNGVVISFDDAQMYKLSGGMDCVEQKTLLTINNNDILDLFPPEYANLFPFARIKRAAPQSELPRPPMAILPSKAALASAIVNTKRRGDLA